MGDFDKGTRVRLNALKGKLGEELYEGEQLARGNKTEKTHAGPDFDVTEVDDLGNPVRKKKAEVKTGKSRVRKLQKNADEVVRYSI